MGWKAVKEHYRVTHIVQVTDAGICIGSPYIHDLIVISPEGEITKSSDSTVNADLVRYQNEMKADPGKLRELVAAKDDFATSIPVFTYRGAEILEKMCEEPGWPNVTHDGDIMYENMFSADRTKVVEWARSNCLAGIRFWRDDVLPDRREKLAEAERELAKRLADAEALGVEPVA